VCTPSARSLRARATADAIDARDRTTATVSTEIASTRKVAEALKVKLAGVRGGALPKEVEAAVAAGKAALAEANALTVEAVNADASAKRRAEAARLTELQRTATAALAASLDKAVAAVSEETAVGEQRVAAATGRAGTGEVVGPATHVVRVVRDGAGGGAAGTGTLNGAADELDALPIAGVTAVVGPSRAGRQ